MSYNENIVRGWLTAVPPSDGNYISALQRATEAELQEAISVMEARNGKDKSRITACRRELNRRAKKGVGHEI